MKPTEMWCLIINIIQFLQQLLLYTKSSQKGLNP